MYQKHGIELQSTYLYGHSHAQFHNLLTCIIVNGRQKVIGLYKSKVSITHSYITNCEAITFIIVVEGSQLKGLPVICISAIRQKQQN